MCFPPYQNDCPWIISVKEIGINALESRGCVMNKEWLDSFMVSCHHSLFNPMIYIDLPHKKLTCIRTVSQGKFGYIDVARYDTIHGTKEVYVKRPISDKRSDKTVYEPYLQQMVREGLARFGFRDHVPRVLDVFRLRNETICFAMEQVDGGVTMDTYLNTHSSADLSDIIMDILYQVTMMVWVINDGLGVNHRDLKPSNFILRIEPEDVHYSFEVDGMEQRVEWDTNLHLSLIDFGFTCIGAASTRRSYLSLSTVYSEADPCPKDGRDMFLFLGYLYSDYYHRMTDTLRGWFEEWLEIPGSDFCGFLRKSNDASKQWLYYLSGSEKVCQLRSCPATIIKRLLTA